MDLAIVIGLCLGCIGAGGYSPVSVGSETAREGFLCIVKTFDRWFAVVLFATNRRLFSMSRVFTRLCNGKVKDAVRSGWTYLGSRGIGVLSLFCAEKGLVFEKFLKVSPTTEDLYGNKELFFIDDGG